MTSRPSPDKKGEGMAICEGGKYAVCVDEKNCTYGWVHQRHPDGPWFTVRRATEDELARAKSAYDSCKNFWADFGPAVDEAAAARAQSSAREPLDAELYQAMLTLQHRCGYIINFCKDTLEMKLEAEEMLRVLRSLTLPSHAGTPQPSSERAVELAAAVDRMRIEWARASENDDLPDFDGQDLADVLEAASLPTVRNDSVSQKDEKQRLHDQGVRDGLHPPVPPKHRPVA